MSVGALDRRECIKVVFPQQVLFPDRIRHAGSLCRREA